jgi:2-polyprenyl-3-methyl-5-hydroxy-6-metoxy-1,4-benzoquinol methylase
MYNQQEQARRYFHHAARDWHSSAEAQSIEYNVIQARNRATLDIISRVSSVSDFLDVGCGTGQLAIHVAKLGIRSVGVDFAPEMIRVAEENNKKENASALFVCSSLFEAKHSPASYDVISAQGVIEYISLDELEIFFSLCSTTLRAGGSLALGSRNRLFNVVSLNTFTKMEMELGTMDLLVGEAICLQSSAADDLFANLTKHERIDRQPRRHPHTGIGVDVRYQFSPAELISRARGYGFSPEAIYPIHFHAFPGSLKDEHPNLHAEIARFAEQVGLRDHRLVPHSSSFVLDLRKQ